MKEVDKKIESVKNGLEQDIKNIMQQTDNLCSKIIEELVKRIKSVEEAIKKGVPTKRADEILSKQKKEFVFMKKSLDNKLKSAVENMKTEVLSSQRKPMTAKENINASKIRKSLRNKKSTSIFTKGPE